MNAIIAPIERSMPPEMTTIAWATAARASGSHRDGEALDARRAVVRLDELREDQEDREEERAARSSTAFRRTARATSSIAFEVPPATGRAAALIDRPPSVGCSASSGAAGASSAPR